MGRAEVRVALNDRAERYRSCNLVTERDATGELALLLGGISVSEVPQKAHRDYRFFDKNTEIKEVIIRNAPIESIPLRGVCIKSVDRRLTVGSPSGMTR